jgi:hypothetical protein
MTHAVVLIKNIWSRYSGNFIALLLASLPLGVTMALGNIVNAFFPLSYLETAIPLPRLAVIGIYALAVLIYGILCLICSISLYLNANHLFENQKTEIKKSFGQSVSLFLPVLWVSILRSLIVIGGTILLIVPGVIWGLRYMYAEQTVMFEGKRGSKALTRSREITEGKLFTLFIDIIAIGIILAGAILILSWGITLFLSIIGVLVYNMTGSETTLTILSYVVFSLTIIIRWLVISLPILAIVALYRDFKENRG